MKKDIATQKLPDGYQESAQFDLDENHGYALMLNLLGLAVLFGVGWLLIQSLAWLRPEYLSSGNILIITGMREFWRGIFLLVASLGFMIVLNEILRSLILLILTHRLPRLRLRGFFRTKYSSRWFLRRWAFLMSRLLPVLIITILGLVLVPFAPLNLIPGILLLVALTIASATEDLITAYWLLRKPKDVFVHDSGDRIEIFHRDQS